MERFRLTPWVRILCIVLVLVAVVVCAVIVAVRHAPESVDSIRLDRAEVVFTAFSQTCLLRAETSPKISDELLTWETSDPSVVTVSASGLLKPVGRGQATVTVSGPRGNGRATCRVTVKTIDSVTFALQDEAIPVGSTRKLSYTVVPVDADTSYLNWASTSPSVASVDGYGKVTGLKAGSADIVVTDSDGRNLGACTVTVTAHVPIEGLHFDVTEFTVTSPEDVLVLTPRYTPEYTSQRELTWISSDESVATVDPLTGTVTAHSNGTVTIMAKSLYGEITAVCNVTVDMNIPLQGLSVEKKSYTFSKIGRTYRIVPVFEPENASNKSLKWTSQNPSVATVSDQGVVKSVKRGETVIRLVSEDGGFVAEFKVSVSPNDRISVTGITLSDYSITFSELGETETLKGTVKPSNATEKGVRYASNNTSVATVSSSGTVKAVGYGTTQITVTSVDGGYSEVCTVVVPAPVIKPPSPVQPELEYVEGVWVATVANIDFPSKNGLSADQLKAEIDTIMDNVASLGLNTVYFQVRPCGDALYPSQYYPSSYYVVKNQGDELPLDILAYAITAAHARGLELHAWLNPYRVTNSTAHTLESLAPTNPAILHPEWVLTDGKKLYLNPGIPEVRRYIIDGVMEIVKNYDVDGIHFDDYFYPTVNETYEKGEAASFAKYGGSMSLADWRRSNTDALIKGVHDAISDYTTTVIFGVSPAAVWATSEHHADGAEGVVGAHETYFDAYADTRKWVKNEWLDYICPQVYFQMDHSRAPFDKVVDWWNDTVSGTDVRLYIGIGSYRCEDTAAYQTGTEIPTQLDYLDTKANVTGAVFYNYTSLVKNYADVGDQVKARYYTEPLSSTLQFNQSSMTLDSSYKTAYVVGVSDPNSPLYANGVLVDRTREGYFALKVTLEGTKTVVVFEHKDQTVEYVITRTSSTSSSGNYMSEFGFVSGSFTPSYDVADKSGAEISFSCVAPAGSAVKVQIGSYTVDLKTKTADPENGKYRKATYSGTLILPQIDEDGNATLGYPVFTATRKGESATYSPGCLVEVINDPSSYAMVVSTDKSDVRPNLEVDPEFFYMATEGAKVHVVSKADGVVKMTNGMYLSTQDVERLEKDVAECRVLSSSVNVAKSHTVFSWKMTESAFHTVWMDVSFAEITFYGIEGDLPAFSLPENPLFSKATVARVDETTVRVTLTYKDDLHIYGYYCNFDGNTLYVNFRNPVTLAEGDKPLTGVVVSLDPGHSQSSGAVYLYKGKEVLESELNMTLSLKTAAELEKLGATVVLTHLGEQTYSLEELIVRYRALSPDVNVSVHFNASEYLASGTETFWCYGNSHLLSDILLDSFTEDTGFKARKSACDYYKVSRLCEFPSILFETAYMSNPGDLAYFMDEDNMDAAALALAEAIYDFFLAQND